MAILSFRHNFIFIKTMKTAGTSIEVDLSDISGERAVVTPIIPAVSGHRARNYLAEDGTALFYNHMSASVIRDLIGEEQFSQMYKFCVERELVSKCVSHFHMLRNSPIHSQDGRYNLSWQEYCEAGKFPIDLGKYTESENGSRVLMVDKVLPYERIAQSLAQLLQGLNVDGFVLKTRAKSEHSQNPLVDISKVTEGQRQLIYSAFAESCKLTGMYRYSHSQ